MTSIESEQEFSFELEKFLLSDCSIKTTEAFAAGPRKGWRLMFKTLALVHADQSAVDELKVVMLTRFMLDIFLERPETKRTSHAVKSLVDFEVDYMAFFKFADSNTIPKETEFFETFALREGIQCCHPYIQEHISNMIARMGLPPLMLGLSDLDLSVMEPPITASSK